MNTYWNILNWLISHRLKYLALLVYGSLSLLILPVLWLLKLWQYFLASEECLNISLSISQIIKGDKV